MDKKFLILTCKWNDMITRPLKEGANDTLIDAGVSEKNIKNVWIPGAFELPVAASVAAKSGKWDAIICLGCVIKGDTAHFDFVAGPSASGMMNVSVNTGVPVINGVLTTENVEQALNRAGIKMGNKGIEAAQAALSMTKVLDDLK
jgi:6,7-dimethyl-8-ribityllumazine synthase